MSTFKKLCKLIKPGEFSKLIDEIDEALNLDKGFKINSILNAKRREMKKKYLIIEKKFNQLKNDKNCNNNSNSNHKKIKAIELLLEVLEIKIDYRKTKKETIRTKLNSIKDKIDNLNITINSVDKSAKILEREIDFLNEEININVEANQFVSNTYTNNLSRKLKNLKTPHTGGKRRTRKLKH
jgi:chromosome segregation ATPase